MLKNLEKLTKIDNHELIIMDDLRERYPEKFTESGQMDWKWFETTLRPNHSIFLRIDKQSLSFTFGKGACKPSALIAAAMAMLEKSDANSYLIDAYSILKTEQDDGEGLVFE